MTISMEAIVVPVLAGVLVFLGRNATVSELLRCLALVSLCVAVIVVDGLGSFEGSAVDFLVLRVSHRMTAWLAGGYSVLLACLLLLVRASIRRSRHGEPDGS